MKKPHQSHLYHSLDILVEEAIEFIRANEPPQGYHLGFSGGKDSQVTEHLAKMAGVKYELVYSCTGIDPPEAVRFIREYYPQTAFKYPEYTYWKGILKKNPPTVMKRWCCDILKKFPTKYGNPNRLLGIRAEESKKRAKRGRIEPYKWKQLQYYPVFHWTEADIWEFIEQYELPYCKLYDEGWNRIGCLCCPFGNEGEHRRNKIKYPQIYKVFEKVVKQRWEMLKEKGKPMFHDTSEEYLDGWYKKKGQLFVRREE